MEYLEYLLKVLSNQNKELYVLNDCLQSTRKLLQRERQRVKDLLERIKELEIRETKVSS